MGVARTFQVVRPFANLTVLENVAVGAMYGTGGARRSAAEAMRKAEQVLERVHLLSRRDDPAASLPIGGRKRLELAKALAMEPRLLLLDEVMAPLRGAEVDEAMDLIRTINQQGISILVIEHVMKVIVGILQPGGRARLRASDRRGHTRGGDPQPGRHPRVPGEEVWRPPARVTALRPSSANLKKKSSPTEWGRGE